MEEKGRIERQKYVKGSRKLELEKTKLIMEKL